MNRNEVRIKLLSLVDLLEPLSLEEIERLEGRLSYLQLESGEIFYGPEDRSEKLYLIQRGRVRVFKTAPDGRELTLVAE